MNREERKNQAELANELREQLAALGFCADDMNLKELRTAKAVMQAIREVKAKREDAERTLETTHVTISEIARMADLDRSNLYNNKLYQALIEKGSMTEKEAKYDMKLNELQSMLQQERNANAEYRRRESLNFDLNVRIGNLQCEIAELRRRVNLLETSLSDANAKNAELTLKLNTRQQVITMPISSGSAS